MDRLRANLSRVRIPESSNKIYKEECCISFRTPKSDGGLFVDLNTFLAFGREYVTWNYQKSGDSVYLNIQRKLKPITDDRPLKKPTIMGIGTEGGFDMSGPEYEDFYKIVVLPDFIELPYPNVNLPEKVRLAVEGVLAAQGAERRDRVAEWTAEKKRVSKYASDLKQLDNGVRVPATGWKCIKCDKVENLWMNLTDGTVLCGRRNWDGSGGNNHAVQHYETTRYPLAVKLGTITADLDQADVYSYPEDETVEDPFLGRHLAHFGIDFSALEKTEMTTAERELDQNLNFDWFRIQEKGKELEPLFGPGYTGMSNLGNSCYLASVVQVVFSTTDFQHRYYKNLTLREAFDSALADPTLDHTAQLAKLAHGLLSGKYSVPSQEASGKQGGEGESVLVQEGIPPRMFKSLLGTGHPEFSSGRQQDALEFFQHLLDVVERTNTGGRRDPSRCLRFLVEERIQCTSSSNVKYNYRVDNVLSLGIPLDAAVNKEEVAEYERQKAEKMAAGEKMEGAVVRPRVPLSACLELFSAEEEVADFYSSAIGMKTTAIKRTRLRTFPDYLVLHMKKFVHDVGWVAKKLDVFIDVPDEIDISSMRGKGLQPGEVELPETPEPGEQQEGPVADEAVVQTLVEMGFPQIRCEKAAINTDNTGPEDAMNWLLAHLDDADIDEPIRPLSRGGSSGGSSTMAVDEGSLDMLTAIGCSKEVARKALQATGGDVERAAEWVFSHPEAEAMEVDASNRAAEMGSRTPQRPSVPGPEDLPDGSGKYKLMAFISHMGSSTQVGHYVCHIMKEGRWVIFNDAKVAASGDPPKDMGYLYFFQRAQASSS